MSTSTTKIKKQIGDRVVITGGPRKGMQGNISELQGLKATIKLDDGTEVRAGVAWLDLVPTEQLVAPVETAETESEPIPVETAIEPEATQTLEVTPDTAPPESQPVEPTVSEQAPEPATVAPESAPVATKRTRKRNTEPVPETATESNVVQNPYEKMTVVELQKLAKERDISIARTKADFVRIIQQQEPDIDIDTLKGPALFNKVSELHISRLRSKKDLVGLLTTN